MTQFVKIHWRRGLASLDMVWDWAPCELHLGPVGVIPQAHLLIANWVPGTGLYAGDGCRGQNPWSLP